MNCVRCQDPSWNPVLECSQCGFSIAFKLCHPSEYQITKYAKHGLLYNGVETIVDESAWLNASFGSKFIPGLDMSSTITMVASSGETVIPYDGNRSRSYVFYIGKPTGGGFFSEKFEYFYAVRVVNASDEDTIHFFPDTIRSTIDKEVVCGHCDKGYKVSYIPKFCECGKQFS